MPERKFSELPSAASLTGNELAALSQMQSGSLASVKSTLQAIANWFAVYAQYTTALQTTDKSIAGAINELKQLISLIPQFSIEVVETLPTEDISDTTIYLVPAEDPEVGNYYEEYIHVNNTWELVGTTAVDLSAYYTKLEVDGLLADKLEADDFEANQTASANPITLETKQAGLAKSCVVEMNPIQDLHGYSNPWVGGAGKNKSNISDKNFSAGVNKNELLISNLSLLAGTYTLSFSIDTNISSTRNRPMYTKNGINTYAPNDYNTKGRSSWTFTLSEDSTVNMYWWVVDNSTEFNITDFMVEVGSTATSYAPYSNICPISGRTEVSVTRTAGEDVETKTKELGQTVYSGSLDLTSGIATIEQTKLVLDGTENWSADTGRNGVYYLFNTMASSTYADCVCDRFKTIHSNAEMQSLGIAFGIQNKAIYIPRLFDGAISGVTDVASWKTYLSNNNMEITYPLSTPTTIQLSPEALTLLKGQNVISTDGDKVQVEFSDIPVGDYSTLLDYIKSLEARIEALEG